LVAEIRAIKGTGKPTKEHRADTTLAHQSPEAKNRKVHMDSDPWQQRIAFPAALLHPLPLLPF
jgi:hypothetical protein